MSEELELRPADTIDRAAELASAMPAAVDAASRGVPGPVGERLAEALKARATECLASLG